MADSKRLCEGIPLGTAVVGDDGVTGEWPRSVALRAKEHIPFANWNHS